MMALDDQVITGYCGSKVVLTGNAVAEIVGTILIPLCDFLGIYFVLENPFSSVIFKWPSIEPWMGDPRCHSVSVDMAVFGCICAKQLSLRGTWGGLPMLKALEVALKKMLPEGYLVLEKASQPVGRSGPGSGSAYVKKLHN